MAMKVGLEVGDPLKNVMKGCPLGVIQGEKNSSRYRRRWL